MKTAGTRKGEHTYDVVTLLEGEMAHQRVNRAIRNTPDLLSVGTACLDIVGAECFDLAIFRHPSRRRIELASMTCKKEEDRVVSLNE